MPKSDYATPLTFLVILLGLVLQGLPPRAAEIRTYRIDSEQSSVTLGGQVLIVKISEQAPGSLTTQVSGEIVTKMSGGSIQFLPESLLRAEVSGVWRPGLDGEPGEAPAAFGGALTHLVATGDAALRQSSIALSSAPLALDGDSFAATNVVINIPETPATLFDFRATNGLSGDLLAGSLPLTGEGDNNLAAPGAIDETPGAQTITVPVNATFIFTAFVEGDTFIDIVGELNATLESIEFRPEFRNVTILPDNQLELTWDARPGFNYRLEQTANFQTWNTTVDGLTTTDDFISFNLELDQDHGIFRVLETP